MPHKLVVNRLTMTLGRLSYSLYLLHFFVIQLAIGLVQFVLIPYLHWQPNFITAFALVATVTTALSAITFRFIESRGQELGAVVIDRLNGRTLP